MLSDKTKWDRIYNTKTSSETRVPDFIRPYLGRLKSGVILDLACGTGALSAQFCGEGQQLVGLDISYVALRQCQSGPPVKQRALVQADNDAPSLPFKAQAFSSIIIFRYKPTPELWPKLVHILEVGGSLLLATFNQQHHLCTGFNARFCLQAKELTEIHPQLALQHYQSSESKDGHFDLYLFTKTAQLSSD